MTAAQLPLLSSFRLIDGVEYTDFSHINARTVRLCSSTDRPAPVSNMVLPLPRMQQSAVSHQVRLDNVLAPPSAAPAALSSLVYLELLYTLTLADCRYLLTPASPPCFAAQLTHLALRVSWGAGADVAALLPSLPVMYPSLTHVRTETAYQS